MRVSTIIIPETLGSTIATIFRRFVARVYGSNPSTTLITATNKGHAPAGAQLICREEDKVVRIRGEDPEAGEDAAISPARRWTTPGQGIAGRSPSNARSRSLNKVCPAVLGTTIAMQRGIGNGLQDTIWNACQIAVCLVLLQLGNVCHRYVEARDRLSTSH